MEQFVHHLLESVRLTKGKGGGGREAKDSTEYLGASERFRLGLVESNREWR